MQSVRLKIKPLQTWIQPFRKKKSVPKFYHSAECALCGSLVYLKMWIYFIAPSPQTLEVLNPQRFFIHQFFMTTMM